MVANAKLCRRRLGGRLTAQGRPCRPSRQPAFRLVCWLDVWLIIIV